jgi:hypothetical protein
MEPCEWRCSHHSCPVVCGSVSPGKAPYTFLLSPCLDLFSLTLRHTVQTKTSLWPRMSFGYVCCLPTSALNPY